MSHIQNMFHCPLQEYQNVTQLQCQNLSVSFILKYGSFGPDFKVMTENVTTPETCSDSSTREKNGL